jgi:hypothetical protein
MLEFYRIGWRPAAGWGLAVVVTTGGLYEFVLRHFFKLPGNDIMGFVAYLTAVAGMVYLRGREKSQGAE